MPCTPCGRSVPAGAAEVGADGPRMLAEALAAEASSAAKRSKDPFADLGVKFVEVRGRPLPTQGVRRRWHRLALADVISPLAALINPFKVVASGPASSLGGWPASAPVLRGLCLLPTARAARTAQVKQEKLRYIDPVAKEATNATRTAFGADYEARLRAEAGAKPDKLSRRKHQISSLYHNAKMKARPPARPDLPGRGPGRSVQRSGATAPSLLHPAHTAGRPCQPPCLHSGLPGLATGPTACTPAPGAPTGGCRGRAGAGDAGHAQPGHEDQGADAGQVWLVAPAAAQGPRCKFHSVQACGMSRGWLSRHSASACRDGVCKQRPAVRHHRTQASACCSACFTPGAAGAHPQAPL